MYLRKLHPFIVLIISVLYLIFTSCVKDSNLSISSDTSIIAKIYQPDNSLGNDATIESITPDQNFGSSAHSAIFSWTNGGLFNTSRALIQFDLSEIPPQTKISSAKLSLFWISNGNLIEHTGENSFTIYRITGNWDESTITWNTQPQITNIDSVNVSESIFSTQSYKDIDVTKLVQYMINNPTSNHGMMLKLNEEFPYKLVIIASSDYTDSSKRPKLVVYY